MLFDTHLHLTQLSQNPPAFYLDHPYLALSVSTNLADSLDNLAKCQNSSHIMPALGLHPWFVKQQTLQELDKIFELVLSQQVGVLGELGLDFSANFIATKDLQLDAFEQQLNFAKEHNLSVSIHLFKAYESAYKLLAQYKVKGVLHGFVGGYQEAVRFTKLGLLIGVNGVILRDNAVRYHRLIQELDLEYLVLETDAPNIKFPDTAEFNFSMLYKVAQKVADLKQLPVNQVLEQTYSNAQKVFNFNVN